MDPSHKPCTNNPSHSDARPRQCPRGQPQLLHRCSLLWGASLWPCMITRGRARQSSRCSVATASALWGSTILLRVGTKQSRCARERYAMQQQASQQQQQQQHLCAATCALLHSVPSLSCSVSHHERAVRLCQCHASSAALVIDQPQFIHSRAASILLHAASKGKKAMLT